MGTCGNGFDCRYPSERVPTLSHKHVIPWFLFNMLMQVHKNLERLYEHAIHHATDLDNPEIFDGVLILGSYEGVTCFTIDSTVQAPMRKQCYNTKAAITHQHFVAPECGCRAGFSNMPTQHVKPCDVGNGRIVCTHAITLALLLRLGLPRGLSHHVLVSLRSRLQREDCVRA